MIDNGTKSWTLFTYKPDAVNDGRWIVVGTRWNNSGPTNDQRICGGYESEQGAANACLKMQQEYDRLRDILYRSAKEANTP